MVFSSDETWKEVHKTHKILHIVNRWKKKIRVLVQLQYFINTLIPLQREGSINACIFQLAPQ